MATNWPTPVTGEDFFRQTSRRLDRLQRTAVPVSAGALMGPGMGAQAIQIMDWNDEIATFNGFFWTAPGALNTPEVLVYEYDEETGMPVGEPEVLEPIPWSGMVVARDDGTGSQHIWNTDEPESMLSRVRNYWPNPDDPTAPPVFSEWMLWATSTGFIGGEDLDPVVQDGIDNIYQTAVQAVLDAEKAFDFAESANAVFRQPNPPVPVPGSLVLRVNDTWFDTDDGNRPYRWSGSAWIESTSAWLKTNPTGSFPNTVISPAGLAAYNAAGIAVTTIDSATGTITTTGSIWTNGEINGAIVTGGQIQTDASPLSPTSLRRGIKMNSSGFAAYSNGSIPGIAAGQPTFTIDANTGAVAMLGSLTSGSTVLGATITGGVVQTAASGVRASLETFGGNGRLLFWNGSTNIGGVYGIGIGSGNIVIAGPGGVTDGQINISMSGVNITGQAFCGSDLDVAGDLHGNRVFIDSLDVASGGEQVYMLGGGRLVAHAVPSHSAYKRDVDLLAVDLDALAAVETIRYRYRDDVPFEVADPDEVFYGVRAEQAAEAAEFLVGRDGDGEVHDFKERRLPLALLAGFADHHARVGALEAEVADLRRQLVALRS